MKKIAVAGLIVTALITSLCHLPLSWVGNSIIPNTLEPKPVFLGTLWKGQITNIEGLNPVDTAFDVRQIFRGGAPVSFESQSPFLRFFGSASLKGAVSVQAKGDVPGLKVFDPRFRSLNGSYDLSLKDFIVRESCLSGSGEFTTNILRENFAAWQWKGPILSGPILCEDGQVIAALSGRDADQDISVNLQLDIDGQYRANAIVKTSNPQAGFVLPLFGFEKTAQGYSLSEAGAWR